MNVELPTVLPGNRLLKSRVGSCRIYSPNIRKISGKNSKCAFGGVEVGLYVDQPYSTSYSVNCVPDYK